MKMEPIVSSETSAIRTQTPGNYPKRNNLHLEHGESLRTRYGREAWPATVNISMADRRQFSYRKLRESHFCTDIDNGMKNDKIENSPLDTPRKEQADSSRTK